MNIVMEAWRELCLLIQPGSLDGIAACESAIAGGPPIQPCEETIKEMELAKADPGPYAEEYYQGPVTGFTAVIDGMVQLDDVPLSDKEKLRSRYPRFIRWSAEVFPG